MLVIRTAFDQHIVPLDAQRPSACIQTPCGVFDAEVLRVALLDGVLQRLLILLLDDAAKLACYIGRQVGELAGALGKVTSFVGVKSRPLLQHARPALFIGYFTHKGFERVFRAVERYRINRPLFITVRTQRLYVAFQQFFERFIHRFGA